MLLPRSKPLKSPATVQLEAILKHVGRHKSFTCQDARWSDPKTTTEIEIPIIAPANSRPLCSGSQRSASGYDREAKRRFEFVSL